MVESESNGHVGPDTLIEFAAGRLAPPRTAQIGGHLESCGACRAELALARAFVEAPDRPPPAALDERMRARFHQALAEVDSHPLEDVARPLRPARQRSPWWRTGAARGWLAAASIVAVGVVTWQAIQSGRQVRPTGVERGIEAEAAWLPTVSGVANDRVRIAWIALAQADSYLVEILTVAGQTVWQAQSAGTTTELARGDLHPAGDPRQPLLVRVTATGPGGFRRESDLGSLAAALPDSSRP